MTSIFRVTSPRAAIASLVGICGLIAAISIATTSDPSVPEDATGVARAPEYDPSRLTELHPRDAIPSLDAPTFTSAASVKWLEPEEPVIAVQIGRDARAYPLKILMWHEIVNDEIGGRPVAVTYCPLCNTAVTFRRPEVQGEITTFGTSGSLYRTNLLIYDRASRSLWPQLTGIAVRGEMAGSSLLRVPSPIVSWDDFREAFPKGRVLSRETGFDRPYGINPYPGYDGRATPTFDVEGGIDDRLPTMERVLGVRAGDEVVAYPFSRLERAAEERGAAAVNETLGGEQVVVFWVPGTASPVDERNMAGSRDVGSAVALSRVTGDRTLRFEVHEGRIVDGRTGSTWNLFGMATRGPLRGERLSTVDGIDAFWFNWVSFHPKTGIWLDE